LQAIRGKFVVCTGLEFLPPSKLMVAQRFPNAIYVYFDNDQAGYAVRNALAFKKIVLGR